MDFLVTGGNLPFFKWFFSENFILDFSFPTSLTFHSFPNSTCTMALPLISLKKMKGHKKELTHHSVEAQSTAPILVCVQPFPSPTLFLTLSVASPQQNAGVCLGSFHSNFIHFQRSPPSQPMQHLTQQKLYTCSLICLLFSIFNRILLNPVLKTPLKSVLVVLFFHDAYLYLPSLDLLPNSTQFFLFLGLLEISDL